MVELNFVRSTETDGFKDGADIRLSTIVDILDETAFSSSMSLEMANSLFEGSAIHDTLGKVHGILGANMETYDPSTLIQAISMIVGYNQQMYYDIICIMRALIEVADNAEKNNFIRMIGHIASAEVAGHATYESEDRTEQEAATKETESDSVDATEEAPAE